MSCPEARIADQPSQDSEVFAKWLLLLLAVHCVGRSQDIWYPVLPQQCPHAEGRLHACSRTGGRLQVLQQSHKEPDSSGCVQKCGFVSFQSMNERENESSAAVVLSQTLDLALGCLFNLVYRISCLAAGQGLGRTGRMSDLTSCHLSRCPQVIFWSVSESSRQKAHTIGKWWQVFFFWETSLPTFSVPVADDWT